MKKKSSNGRNSIANNFLILIFIFPKIEIWSSQILIFHAENKISERKDRRHPVTYHEDRPWGQDQCIDFRVIIQDGDSEQQKFRQLLHGTVQTATSATSAGHLRDTSP